MDLGSELMLSDCNYWCGGICLGLRIPYSRCTREQLRLKLGKWQQVATVSGAGMPVKEIRDTGNVRIEVLYYAGYATVRQL